MWPLQQPNAAPSESESKALVKLLEQQQSLVSSIEKLRKESDEEYQRLSCRATALQETLKNMETLNNMGSVMQAGTIPQFDAFSKEYLDMEEKRDALQPLFDGTTTIFNSFSAVNDAINLFKSTLEAAVGQLPDFFALVARELYSTEMLRAQTANTMTSFSDMVGIAQQSITLKQNGVLHPLRRLPEEVLVQIFERCVNEEAEEWLTYFANMPQNPKVPTRIAGVCRRWRSIALSCPRLWCHLLAPISVTHRIDVYSYPYYYDRTSDQGIDHFRRALQLCEERNLELTIPINFNFPPDIDITTLDVRCINILDASQTLPPVLPSPRHLWLGHDATGGTLSQQIPLSWLSNTSKITASSVSLTFESPAVAVTHLVLCGQHITLPFSALLRSLPRLVNFDAKNARLSGRPEVNPEQPNIHSQLRTLAVGGTGLAFLEQALAEGLRFPNLHLFEIADLQSEDFTGNYPSISTHMSGHTTHLGISGTVQAATAALRTFIDMFSRLDTISLHGAATEPALQALYHTVSGDGDNSGVEYSVPKTVQSVIICDYQESGEEIHRRLHEMRADPVLGSESIQIIFQDCLNIHPNIRKELCSSLVVQPTGKAQ